MSNEERANAALLQGKREAQRRLTNILEFHPLERMVRERIQLELEQMFSLGYIRACEDAGTIVMSHA